MKALDLEYENILSKLSKRDASIIRLKYQELQDLFLYTITNRKKGSSFVFYATMIIIYILGTIVGSLLW